MSPIDFDKVGESLGVVMNQGANAPPSSGARRVAGAVGKGAGDWEMSPTERMILAELITGDDSFARAWRGQGRYDSASERAYHVACECVRAGITSIPGLSAVLWEHHGKLSIRKADHLNWYPYTAGNALEEVSEVRDERARKLAEQERKSAVLGATVSASADADEQIREIGMQAGVNLKKAVYFGETEEPQYALEVITPDGEVRVMLGTRASMYASHARLKAALAPVAIAPPFLGSKAAGFDKWIFKLVHRAVRVDQADNPLDEVAEWLSDYVGSAADALRVIEEREHGEALTPEEYRQRKLSQIVDTEPFLDDLCWHIHMNTLRRWLEGQGVKLSAQALGPRLDAAGWKGKQVSGRVAGGRKIKRWFWVSPPRWEP